MKRFVFSIFTVLVLAPCGFAIIDVNLNDVSDLWERNFNNGSLFDGSFDPQADDDSDGWSNLQEASAGTDPFDPNPPDGIVQLLTGHTAEVRSEPDEYGSSYIITPEAVTVSWPTLVGKQYTLLFSPDLSAGSWVPIGDAFIGNGNEVTYGFTISESDKRFWRVAVCDVDSDNDGLTDHEEFLSGTNPATADSDSDGLTDLYELGLGTSPVNADSDGDGMSDYYESTNNFNPNDSGDADIDSDGDGLSNLQESILGTDPNSPDDHSDVGDEAVVNGSFSEPTIFVPGPDGKGTTGLEATKGEAGWNYWAGIPGWKAVQGENVELQTFATGPEDPNVELKAQPEGHRGIKQWIKTRVGVSYLVMFKALPRPYIGDASLNNFEVYADETRIKEITYTGEVDPDTVDWEKHTAVFTAQQVLTKLSFVVPESNPDNTLGCIVDEIAIFPVEVVELSPKVRDLTTNDEIDGSEVPDLREGRTNPMVEINPVQDKIAHRELKIRIGNGNAFEGKNVTWSMVPLFAHPPGGDPDFRGDWSNSQEHSDRFEASTAYGNNSYERLSQQQGRTQIDAEGFTAIRSNLPPVGLNKARIIIEIEGVDTTINLIDMEVPAIIVIDPGHGGPEGAANGGSSWNNATSFGVDPPLSSDPRQQGESWEDYCARVGKTLEKDLTLLWGIEFRAAIATAFDDADHAHYRILMTRTTDVNPTIAGRPQIAQDNGADIFFSIHFNGHTDTAIHGPETWIETEAAGNVNHASDLDLAERVQDALDANIPNAQQPGQAGYRGIKQGTVSGVFRDNNLGNQANQPPHIRACLAEVDWITNEDVEISLISGTNAATNRGAVLGGIAASIVEDIEHQE